MYGLSAIDSFCISTLKRGIIKCFAIFVLY